jgi:hypothetical protein
MITKSRIDVITNTALLILLFGGLLTGCMTFESPSTKYVWTPDGVTKIDKTAANPAETTQESVVDSQTAAVEQKSGTDTWTANKEGAWGFCCRNGRGSDPSPMTRVDFAYPIDVDTAYIRIKQDFGFNSREDLAYNEFAQDFLDSQSLLHMRYEATPGVHYKMRNFVKHPYGTEEGSNTIEVELTRNGSDKVKVRVAYYSGAMRDVSGYGASLKQRIVKLLSAG